MGRPSTYKKETADELCRLLSEGNTLISIVKMDGMPSHEGVYCWMRNNPDFAENYARARAIQADYYAEEGIEIANKAGPMDAAVAKLQIEARKWYAGKIKAKKWGDRQTTELSGPDGGPIPVAAVTLDAGTLDQNQRNALRTALMATKVKGGATDGDV